MDKRHIDKIEKEWEIFLKYKKSVSSEIFLYDSYRKIDPLIDAIISRNSIFEQYITKEDIIEKVIFGKSGDEILDIVDLKTFLNQIPNKYIFKFPFFDVLDNDQNYFKLSDNVWIERIDSKKNQVDASGEKENINSSFFSLLSNMSSTNVDGVYICLRQEGYLSDVFESSFWKRGVGEKSMLFFKRFLYLCYIYDIIVKSYKEISLLDKPIVIFEDRDSNKRIDKIPLSYFNRKLKLSTNTNLDILKKLQEFASFLHDKENDNSDHIKMALDWSLDANEKEDHPTSFISYFISIEIILSHGLKMGKNAEERLQDRCAYLLGNNFKNRDFFSTLFKETYKVRSDLVHGKKIK